MQSHEVLNCFALVYQRASKEAWEQLIQPEIWQSFLVSCALPDYAVPPCLATPPSYAEFDRFARSHYCGGLPTSIMAVESLYRVWTKSPHTQTVFAHENGLFESDSAAHMRYVYHTLAIDRSDAGFLPDDHLSLLLEFLGFLYENNFSAEAHTFIQEHLSWLPQYLEAVETRAPNAQWLHAVTDLLVRYVHRLKQADDTPSLARESANTESR